MTEDNLFQTFLTIILAPVLIVTVLVALPPAQVRATTSQPGSPEFAQLWRPLVLTTYLYLPIVFKPLLDFINGNFEQGRNVGWTESTKSKCGSNPCPLVVNQFPSGVAAHGGSWAAWLGGANNETSELSQAVDIGNSTGLSLSYYHRVESREVSCNFDYAYLQINGNEVTGTRIGLCDRYEKGWEQKVVSLSGYSGLLSFKFVVKTDGSVNSNYFVDDVSIIAP